MKGDDDSAPTEDNRSEKRFEDVVDSDDELLESEAAESEAEGGHVEPARKEPRPPREVREEEEDEEETFESKGDETFVEEDPLAEPYEFDEEEEPTKPAARAFVSVKSAKEFFDTELVYRFDILDLETRNKIVGSYRLELKGNKGGIWTLRLGDQVEVVNRREDADTVLLMQQRDFLNIVNGVLNPQLAIVAQKVKIQGDTNKAVLFQSLLAPTVD